MRVDRWARIVAPLLCLVLGVSQASAQGATGTIRGRITDSSASAPISLVRVQIVGTATGATTNDDGRYTLTAPGGTVRLRLTRLGFAAQEQSVTVAAGATVEANFSLARTAVELAEVVSIGYGSQRRIDLTGSVATVSSNELSKTVISSVEQGLSGRVPGVQVTQGDAAPGGGIRVQIRGVNSMNSGSAQPLYVIDGVPFGNSGISKRTLGATSEENLTSLTETNPLATLSPAEIESVDILKDASATAIYGSRGANGVVLITTKRGRSRASVTSLNYSQGLSTVANEYNMLNAYDYATYVNQSSINIGQEESMLYGGTGRPGSIRPDSIRKLVGDGTNWQDEIFRTALQRDVQLDFSNSDGTGNDYLISGSLMDQRGVVTGSEFRRGGFRNNINRSLYDGALRITGNVGVTQSINNMVRTGTINGYRAIGAVRQALIYTPFQLPDPDRTDPRQEDPASLTAYGASPLRYTDEVKERDALTRGIGNVRGVLTILPGLTADVSVSGNYEARSYQNYFPRTVGEGAGNNGDANQARTDYGNILNENLVRYMRQFGSQSFDVLGGYTTQYDRSAYQAQEVRAFPDDVLGSNVLGNGSLVSPPQTGLYISRLESWLARGNYTAFDKYMFTATVRRDGSSKFAANKKYATFPAFAAAWRISQEPFMRDQTLLSDLKLRLSWGKSGNQAIGPNQSQAAVSGSGCVTHINGTQVPCYRVTQLGNDDLQWETTSQLDAAVDFAFLNSRLSGTVEVYDKKTEDLLQQIQLPTSTGFANAWLNSGSVSNKGIELQVSYDILQGSANGVQWTISGNASKNKNKLVSLGPIPQQFAGRLGAGGNLEVTPFIQKPGFSLGTMWGYQTDGIIKTAEDSIAASAAQGSAQWIGDYRLKDLDGDGAITSKDQTIVGDANAKWQWGLNNSVSYKKWDFSALLTAVRGNSIINTQMMTFLVLSGQGGNVPREVLDNAWDPTTNPDGTNQRPRNNRGGFGNRFLDVFAQDGSYLRLKNVQVGYRVTLPNSRSARIYVNGVNLWTSTDYLGFDPEVSAFGGTDRPGVDQGSYPGSRLITVGVSTQW